jgi:RNA polymerase sigma factor (sigma-70 family)
MRQLYGRARMAGAAAGSTSLVPVPVPLDPPDATAALARRRRRIPASLLRLASDDRLVELVRADSEAAFEALYDRHHRGILAFCRHMLGSPEEAEDAVQHTFMAAYRDLTGSHKPIQLRPWLYTIARNRCLSILRARRDQPLDPFAEPATEHLSAEVQRRQELRDLVRDVGRLPDDQRAALVLAEVGDASHDEIAQVLDVPTVKVKALVFQARSSLIASREARDTPCADVRTQLAQLRGGSLRRNSLRRHVSECTGCREFRDAVREQRKLLAIALPVVPTLALKHSALGAALGSGGAAATAGGGGGSALAAKAAVAVLVAGGGAAGVQAVRHHAPAGTQDGAVAPAGRVAGTASPVAPAGSAAPTAVAGAKQPRRARAARHGRVHARQSRRLARPPANPAPAATTGPGSPASADRQAPAPATTAPPAATATPAPAAAQPSPAATATPAPTGDAGVDIQIGIGDPGGGQGG